MAQITRDGLHFTGHVRRPNKDHLIALKYREHKKMLASLRARATPPATWDSRTYGWVGAIKDQGQCGSCWCFSGTAVCETALYKAGVLQITQRLSEQYNLDCGKNGGCNGDDNTTILDEAQATGIPLTSEYGPYEASSDTCHFKNSETLYKIDKWGFADGNGGNGVTPVADIKAAIMTYGIVGCGVDASFNDPGTGVISGGGDSIDHDVALIGWDDSKGSKGAWIMRNSWGTSWGDGGYAWIEYGAYSIGTESVWAYVNPVAPPIFYP